MEKNGGHRYGVGDGEEGWREKEREREIERI